MSVLIKGKALPKDCESCDLCDYYGCCYALCGDSLWDALNIGEYEREDDDTGTLEISLGGLLDLFHKVKDAPTVIEAEGSGD